MTVVRYQLYGSRTLFPATLPGDPQGIWSLKDPRCRTEDFFHATTEDWDGYMMREGIFALPETRTEVVAARTADALVVGFFAHVGPNGPQVDDYVEALFDPYHDHDTYLRFTYGADGAKSAEYRYDCCTPEPCKRHGDWRPEWQAEASCADGLWRVLFIIPFRCLGDASRHASVWGAAFGRYDASREELVAWGYPTRFNPIPGRMGHLVFHRNEPGPPLRRVELEYDLGSGGAVFRPCLSAGAGGKVSEVRVTTQCGRQPSSPLPAGPQTFIISPRAPNGEAVGKPARVDFEHFPAGELVSPPFSFSPVPVESVERQLAEAHARSEEVYKGDGTWRFEEPKAYRVVRTGADWLPRETAQRVTAYLAWNDAPSEASARIREGLARLARSVGPGGYVPDQLRGMGSPCYLESGVAGEALLMGAKAADCPEVRGAIERMAGWCRTVPVHVNTNYNAYLMWFMTEYAAEYPDGGLRDALRRFLARGVFRGQSLDGAWPGHNYATCYHVVMVKTLAKMLTLGLTDDDPALRRETELRLRWALNHLASRQRADGAVEMRGRTGWSTPEIWLAGSVMDGLWWARKSVGPELDNICHGMAQYALKRKGGFYQRAALLFWARYRQILKGLEESA